jgi:hypothetical protein
VGGTASTNATSAMLNEVVELMTSEEKVGWAALQFFATLPDSGHVRRTMLMEAVARDGGRSSTLIAATHEALRSTRTVSDLDVLWLVYAIRFAARLALTRERDRSYGVLRYNERPGAFEDVCLLGQEFVRYTLAYQRHSQQIIDAMLAVLHDHVPVKAKASAIRNILLITYAELTDEMFEVLIRASPMPDDGFEPTVDQVLMADTWNYGVDVVKENSAHPRVLLFVQRCLISERCRRKLSDMLSDAEKFGLSSRVRSITEVVVRHIQQSNWSSAARARLLVALLRREVSEIAKSTAAPPLSAPDGLSLESDALRTLLAACVEELVKTIRCRINNIRRDGPWHPVAIVRFDSRLAMEDGYSRPGVDCLTLAFHHRWLGDARAHLSFATNCEATRVVWTLYNAMVAAVDSGAADPGYLEAALGDDSVFVRAAAFAVYDVTRPNLPIVQSPSKQMAAVVRLLHEIALQCTRQGPLEDDLLCAELQLFPVKDFIALCGSVQQAVKKASHHHLDGSADALFVAMRDACQHMFGELCALLGHGRNLRDDVSSAACTMLQILSSSVRRQTPDGFPFVDHFWSQAKRVLPNVSVLGLIAQHIVDSFSRTAAKGSPRLEASAVIGRGTCHVRSVNFGSKTALLEITRCAVNFALFGEAADVERFVSFNSREARSPMETAAAALHAPGLLPHLLPQFASHALALADGTGSESPTQRPHCVDHYSGSVLQMARDDEVSPDGVDHYRIGVKAALTVMDRWEREAPDLLRSALYDVVNISTSMIDQRALSSESLVDVLSQVANTAYRLLPAARYDAFMGQFVHWFYAFEREEKPRDVIRCLASSMSHVTNVRHFLLGFPCFAEAVTVMEYGVASLFDAPVAWLDDEGSAGAHAPTAAAATTTGHDGDWEHVTLRAASSMTTVMAPYAELCYRFGHELRVTESSGDMPATFGYISLQTSEDGSESSNDMSSDTDDSNDSSHVSSSDSDAASEEVSKQWRSDIRGHHRRSLRLLAAAASLERNLLRHPPQSAPISPESAVFIVHIDVDGDETETQHNTSQDPLQWKDAIASEVLGLLPRRERFVGYRPCNDNLTAPLTLEFCTSLRSLLMREINAFSTASPGCSAVAMFPTHLALLLLELHLHAVFASGALRTSEMVNECAACFARVRERIPLKVSLTLCLLQGDSVRRMMQFRAGAPTGESAESVGGGPRVECGTDQ